MYSCILVFQPISVFTGRQNRKKQKEREREERDTERETHVAIRLLNILIGLVDWRSVFHKAKSM